MLSPIKRPHPLPSLRRLFSETRPCSSSRRALTPPWTRHPSTRSPPCSSAVRLFCSSSLSLRAAAAEDASPPPLVSSVAPPPPVLVVQWNLTQKHILVLNAIACVTAISAAWLFFSAIPALLAFKRASESMEKLLDVTREELPDTMAAVRLSGMEISDLTMELSDLGQEITQGVRNSTRAVRVAEDKLRRLTNMAPTALLQEQVERRAEMGGPVVARHARRLREGIVQSRAFLQMLFSLAGFSKWAMNYLAALRKKE